MLELSETFQKRHSKLLDQISKFKEMYPNIVLTALVGGVIPIERPSKLGLVGT